MFNLSSGAISFDENYALASTQSLKNKDIPEGGAKGTILPSLGADPRVCFEKYVDAMMDLLIPGQTPGIKDLIVDKYGSPEILFFGPDEGTADMMDWAACTSRHLQRRFFSNFTCSARSESWRAMVEVVHHWEVGRAPWGYSS